MTKIKQIIAFGLTQEEALAAQRSLANTMNCAPENITTTTEPTVIFSLQADEKAVVGVKAHATDQSQRSLLMPVCRYGIKVGDVFHMSWGYDQTSNDFFQVIALVGKSSVRIREVRLNYTSINQGDMYEERIFEIPQDGQMAEYSPRGIFIQDQEKGDVKRILNDNRGVPYIKVSNHYASLVRGKTFKHYESWYG